MPRASRLYSSSQLQSLSAVARGVDSVAHFGSRHVAGANRADLALLHQVVERRSVSSIGVSGSGCAIGRVDPVGLEPLGSLPPRT
jgi:hypothetical protein